MAKDTRKGSIDKNVRIVEGQKFTDQLNPYDLVPIKKDVSGADRYTYLQDLLSFLEETIGSGQGNAGQVHIDYLTSVVTDASWIGGNNENRISTSATTVASVTTNEWHFSRLDMNGANLDLPASTASLWDELISGTRNVDLAFKIYNRENPAEYIWLKAADNLAKANGSPTYFDLKVNAYLLSKGVLEANTIYNPTVVFVPMKPIDVVRNDTDTYTSVDKVFNLITMEQSEYNTLKTGVGTESQTMYAIKYPFNANGSGIDDITIPADIKKVSDVGVVRVLTGSSVTLDLISSYTSKNFIMNIKNMTGATITVNTSGSDTIYGYTAGLTSVSLSDGDNLQLYVATDRYEVL